MRTTVNVDEKVLEWAKARAHERHVTLGELVEEALQRLLLSDANAGEAMPLPVFTRGTGFRPGVDWTSNRGLYEALDADGVLKA